MENFSAWRDEYFNYQNREEAPIEKKLINEDINQIERKILEKEVSRTFYSILSSVLNISEVVSTEG